MMMASDVRVGRFKYIQAEGGERQFGHMMIKAILAIWAHDDYEGNSGNLGTW